ncbi:CoA-binding protein [Phragmitibacter flavus]|uniref:CoA-binding protein n=1 Tax=Phragmitibacter flavus TaxID=2576071 RepID=A0A5R8KBN7_9BACT|nr:CoA-binding protein [Phragmitibacter flavus]TLD69706.1 CoA-binding protein [Phragmitibacter flavus]
MSGRTIVVLGASPKEDRYANMAMHQLMEHGEHAVPVNPAFEEVLGEKCFASIAEVPGPIHTVTLYLGAARSSPLIDEILAAKPQRVVMNPGAENEELARQAESAGIEVVHGCTLVMLRTGTF